MLITKKAEARKYFFDIRKNIVGDERQRAENMIFHNFINSRFFNEFETILCYVSVDDEVDSRMIIDFCIESGKKIYIPNCVGKTMSFYRLNSSKFLIKGKFGIPTVSNVSASVLTDYSGALCIVPAISFDKKGYRIGYGGGYYDRFLDKKNIATLGLTFDKCMTDSLPYERYDKKVGTILTESGFIIPEKSEERDVSTYG